MEIEEVAEDPQEEEEEQVGMEKIPKEAQLPVEEEIQSRIIPVFKSPPHVRENFSEPAENSKGNLGNKEIMKMLVSMKKGNGGKREEVGTTIENKRGISRGRLQKKRTNMETTSQAERRGMEGRNENEGKSAYAKIGLKNTVLLQ